MPLQDVLAASLTVPHGFGRRRGACARAPSDDRSATVFDYLRLAQDSRIVVSERDEVDDHAVKLVEQLQQSYEAALARKDRPLPPSELARRLERWWPHASIREPSWSRSASTTMRRSRRRRTSTTLPAAHVRCQPAPGHARTPRRTGSPRSGALRDEHETTLFVAATAGRAERTIELLKEYEVFAVPVDRADDARYASVLVAVGSAVAGLSTARRRPADLRRDRRLRRGAPGARTPPVRHEGVSLGPARSQGRRSRRPRRSRHRDVRRASSRLACPATPPRSFSSCATRATTSSSFPSSASTSSRNTPARRGRRSIGSAARRGSARSPASRKRCATWRRSCSSSTPRARPSPVTRSAPIRTGSRNSKGRSSTS